MPRILKDRILESSTSVGTGPAVLAGAVTGYRRFNAVCAIGDTVPYFIEALDSVGLPLGDYEWGIGTYSGTDTITRTTVLGSSNGGAAVNFTAGPKNVGLCLMADGFELGSNANGKWMKHPNGLIEQWGNGVTSAAGVAVITFPIPFSAAPSFSEANLVVAGVNNPFFTHADPGSTTGMNVYVCNTAGAPANGASVRWKARGT